MLDDSKQDFRQLDTRLVAHQVLDLRQVRHASGHVLEPALVGLLAGDRDDIRAPREGMLVEGAEPQLRPSPFPTRLSQHPVDHNSGLRFETGTRSMRDYWAHLNAGRGDSLPRWCRMSSSRPQRTRDHSVSDRWPCDMTALVGEGTMGGPATSTTPCSSRDVDLKTMRTPPLSIWMASLGSRGRCTYRCPSSTQISPHIYGAESTRNGFRAD